MTTIILVAVCPSCGIDHIRTTTPRDDSALCWECRAKAADKQLTRPESHEKRAR